MVAYKTDTYSIRCITNLHAGSGDANYGVIDKLVQRDPITNYPCIYAPSIKGAIREHFTSYVNNLPEGFLKYVFGSEKKSEATETGAYRFFSADLLSMPVRSSGSKPFYRVTSKRLLEDFLQKSKALIPAGFSLKSDIDALLGADGSPVSFDGEGGAFLEDYPLRSNDAQNASLLSTSALRLKDWLGEDLVFAGDEAHFRSFSESLPVIVRNQLDNGISANLWYEEVVPRETRFCTFISYPEGNKYTEAFTLNETIVQIGANASIGYGLCQFTKIN